MRAADRPPGRPWRTIAVYAAFAAAVVLATEPVWGRMVFGFAPGFEELLLIRCLGAF